MNKLEDEIRRLAIERRYAERAHQAALDAINADKTARPDGWEKDTIFDEAYEARLKHAKNVVLGFCDWSRLEATEKLASMIRIADSSRFPVDSIADLAMREHFASESWNKAVRVLKAVANISDDKRKSVERQVQSFATEYGNISRLLAEAIDRELA